MAAHMTMTATASSIAGSVFWHLAALSSTIAVGAVSAMRSSCAAVVNAQGEQTAPVPAATGSAASAAAAGSEVPASIACAAERSASDSVAAGSLRDSHRSAGPAVRPRPGGRLDCPCGEVDPLWRGARALVLCDGHRSAGRAVRPQRDGRLDCPCVEADRTRRGVRLDCPCGEADRLRCGSCRGRGARPD